MKTQALAVALLVGISGSMYGQMMGPSESPMAQAPAKAEAKQDAQMPSDKAPVPDAAQEKAAKTFAAKARAAAPAVKPVAKTAVLTPLTQRERVVQLLDRFTYGPRPGEVDRVMAQGVDNWLGAQLNPDSIKDGYLDKRLADFPTVGKSAQDDVTIFPDRQQVDAVALGKVPYPADPLLNAVYEVLVYKRNMEQDQKKADGSGVPRVELTDAEKAEKKKADQAEASRIAGELYALPKDKRMAALIAMPVPDRIAFANYGNLSGDQRNQLMADFTPRERETVNAMASQVNASYNLFQELSQARVLRDVLSERQLQAVMTNFWFNHFNVYIPKDSDEWYTTSYERDVIRKNALGNFHDLLLATAQSPAMMVYLDNYLSIGPDSLANGVDPRNPNSKKQNKGLNENYGREVMELHTVGVNGGYSQADVTALSAILTGWGVDRPGQAGGFMFDPKRHEPGTKIWFGYSIADDGTVTKLPEGVAAKGPTFGPGEWDGKTVATPDSVKQGVAALNILADSPQTAHFISYLMAQYFVSDDPPAALVDRLQKAYLASKGDIKTMIKTLVTSPEFNSKQYFRNKVKTPEEFVASAFRATATDPQNPNAVVNTVKDMGMELYHALPPTGYYLTADKWMNSVALVDRLNFAYALTNNKFANQKFDAPKLLAMGLFMPSAATGDLTVARPVSAAAGGAKLVPTAAVMGGDNAPVAPATASAGAQVAMRVLEATMIGEPVSGQTNMLINKQLQQQPANANPTDTLNLLTALVLGAPEFQVR